MFMFHAFFMSHFIFILLAKIVRERITFIERTLYYYKLS